MRYFTYSPLDMTAAQAHKLAEEFGLRDNHTVHVSLYGCQISYTAQRPRAIPDTYLVRVEQDDSLYVVEKALD